MINITDKHNCCGCGACVQKCPKQSISLQEDSEGFLYPKVNSDTCIDCGLCEKVCPMLNPAEARKPLQVLAAINKDEKIRMESSSGGIFTLLAEKIINEGGVVFGARFDEEWQVTLDYTETIEGLAAFRGSKYVQARTCETYRQCEQFLKNGRKVLYAGSPCQITGLRHYLRKEYDNLLTIDFACHGVPSPKAWKSFLSEVAATPYIQSVNMRAKIKGWIKFGFTVHYEKNTQICVLKGPAVENPYIHAFLSDIILRPSCHACKAKELRSGSDITIADFWGVWKIAPEMHDDKGTSLVLINTEKGSNTFAAIDCKMLDTTYGQAVAFNPAIIRSSRPHPNRAELFAHIDDEPFSTLAYKYAPLSTKQKAKRIVTGILKILIGGGIPELYQLPSNNKYTYIEDIKFRTKEVSWTRYELQIKLK